MSANITGIEKPPLQFSLITRNGNVYVLPDAPKGWEGALITTSRDTKYFGSKRDFTVPMDFVLDGLLILKKEFYQYGIQAITTLVIDKLNPTTQLYENIYKGSIDFSEFSGAKDIVTVPVMDMGIESKIKAYESTLFEIDMSIAEAIDIELTPLTLQETAQFIITQQGQEIHSDGNTNYFPEMNIVTNQQNATIQSVQDVNYFQFDPVDYATSNSWFVQPRTETDVNLKGRIEGVFVGGGYFEIVLYNKAGAQLHFFQQWTQGNGDTHNFGIDFDFSVHCLALDKLYIRAQYAGSPSPTNQIAIFMDGDIQATYNTISPSTLAKGLRPKYVFDQLLKKINQNFVYPTRSYLLDTTWQQLVFTSGDAIRRLPNPKLRITWADFWQSIDAETNAEFGDENGTAVLEAKQNAFKRTLPILNNIGEVKDFVLTPYTDFLYSSVTVGYEDETYDRTGGRKAFNSTQNYTLPITRVQKELNLISTVGSECIEIEILRLGLDGYEAPKQDDTKDTGNDNKPYFVYVKATAEISGAFQPEGVEGYASVTGVQEGTYNIKLSPKQMLYRYGDFINSILDKLNGDRIFFASALKDVSMVTVSMSGQRIAEGENVDVNSLANPFFLPYVCTFKCKIPNWAIASIATMPNGYIPFNWLGNEYRGYIIQVNLNPAKNQSQEFKLLLTPDNNLNLLIE